MKKKIIIGFIIAILILLGLGLYFTQNKNSNLNYNYQNNSEQKQQEQPKVKEKQSNEFADPISNPKQRITKKPFGKYVTPENSPVSPEKFTGYHTGTDFEANQDEINKVVDIFAVCDGKVLQKTEAQGYGGLIVQDCTVSGQKATVLYGHININNPDSPQIGSEIKKGQKIATLADQFSRFSGDERKHLHLGIHRGESIEYLGYVQSRDRLNEWLNSENYL